MKDKPRIGTYQWIKARPGVIAVFNNDYTEDGTHRGHSDSTWAVLSGISEWHYFATHAEAIQYAHQEAGKA